MNVKQSIHNRFDIEVIDAKTGKVKQTAQAFNVICDGLWDCLFNDPTGYNGYFKKLVWGTGSGTPSVADTSLFDNGGELDFTSSSDAYDCDMSTGVAWYRRLFIMDETVGVGSTISEVGIYWKSTVDPSVRRLCTHAMLQDMNGNRITIEKTNTDIINFYATIYLHWNPAGYDGVKLNPPLSAGTNAMYGFGEWLFGLDNLNTVKGTIFHGSSINSGTDTASFTPTMNKTAKTATFAMPRIAAASGNFGGIESVGIYRKHTNIPHSNYFVLVHGDNRSVFSAPSIADEPIGTGDGSTTKFKTAFGLPENATIYVNGTATSGVTVRKMPNTTDCRNQLRLYSYTATQSKLVEIVGKGYTANSSYFKFIGYAGAASIGTGIKDFINTEKVVLKNVLYSHGLEKIVATNCKVYGSNNYSSWTLLGTSETINLSGSAQNYQWYRFDCVDADSEYSANVYPNTWDGYNVVFNSAPAVGAVITADYTTPMIAKDEFHVLDFTLTMQFGDYT